MSSPLGPGIALAALVAGCARITAPDADFAAPQPRVTLEVSQANGAFSHFTGGLTVTAASLHLVSGAAGVVAFAPARPATDIAVYDFTAPQDFIHGDTLSVTWSAPAVTLLGTSYTVQHRAQYRFYGKVGKETKLRDPGARLRVPAEHHG